MADLMTQYRELQEADRDLRSERDALVAERSRIDGSTKAGRSLKMQIESYNRMLRSIGEQFNRVADQLPPQPEVEGCPTCIAQAGKGGPSHHAASHCRSGKRNHCTCDSCF